jgi:hypothetical protein
MPTKTAPKKPTAKPKAAAKKAPDKLEAVPEKLPTSTLSELQDKVIAAVDAKLDDLGTSHGEAAITELRNEFDKVKHHEPWRKLFALARYAPEAK